jgi:hypothetical protein
VGQDQRGLSDSDCFPRNNDSIGEEGRTMAFSVNFSYFVDGTM